MKKRLFAIALTLMLALTLLPVTAYATDEGSTSLGTIFRECLKCNKNTDHEILGYTPRGSGAAHDSVHYIIRKCKVCGEVRTVVDSQDQYKLHDPIDDREPTCTTGRICAKCKLEYGKLPHDWSAWVSNGDGTHTRTCKRDGCGAVDTANCGGGTATCVTPGTCTGCGGQYYGEHTSPSMWKWDSDTDVGRDAESHWVRCLICGDGKTHESNHIFAQGNMYLKSEATCVSEAVYYKNCGICYYKGTETYLGQVNPNKHVGDTEVRNAKPACTEVGYTGDTYCKGCGVKLTDGTAIPVTGHDLKHTAASAATRYTTGNIEYWHCDTCGKYYADAEAKTEITQASTVIPAAGRRPSSTTPAASVSSPKTGDAGVLLYAGTALLSLTGCAWLRRKEK